MSETEGWSSVTRTRTYEQVVDQIRQRILDGRLTAGMHLPNERDFAEQLGCSRASLREALRILESQGIIDVRVGGGRGSGAVITGSPRSSMGDVLELQLALGQYSYDDIVETRMALESWSCLRAASVTDEQTIEELDAILQAMDVPDIAVREFNRLDVEFHATIARSAGNSLTRDFMQILRHAVHSQIIDAYNALPDWRHRAEDVRQEHRAILAAIRDRDGQRASALVVAHISDFFRGRA
ncbi:FadR/GntR family transcriptional regulator [Brachybacterium sp. GCM10030267]|uniref:FadR/GntR family transcriptional regulator n=1 Tax=unclassified Brachybacterium TaxID=2623841 RepID=UPI003618841A